MANGVERSGFVEAVDTMVRRIDGIGDPGKLPVERADVQTPKIILVR